MDDVVCWNQNDEVPLYCNNMQLPYRPMYDGKGKEQVLDMGLQMSGVYQVWHHDIFLPEEEWVVPHYVLRDVASSARAFVMRNGGQFCTTKKKSWDWRSRRQGKSSSIFHQ